MSSFEEQLRRRVISDEESFADAIESIASAVMGEELEQALENQEIAGTAIEHILKYFRCPAKHEETPETISTVEEQLEYRLRPFGIMRRNVTLEKDWYRQAIGPMLGTLKEDGTAVALIPGKFRGYSFVNIKTGKKMPLNRRTESMLNNKAICFYRPLPMRKLTIPDLLKFMLKQLSLADITLSLSLTMVATLLGLLSPRFTKWLFGEVLESGSFRVLMALTVFMVCYSVSKLCLSTFQSLVNSRLNTKQSVAVQAAVMHRIMNLPATFFRDYSSGELAQRAGYVQSLCTTLFSTIGNTGITSLFSLIYIGQIFRYAPSLVVPSLLIIAATLLVSQMVTIEQFKYSRDMMKTSAKTSGMVYSMITGIQKIKLAGAEKRLFARWGKQYAQEAELTYNPSPIVKVGSGLTLMISLTGTLVLYVIALNSNLSTSDYYAFTASYAMISAAFTSLASIASTVANILPMLEMAKPIMETEPETVTGREIVTDITGEIILSHVSFRYDDSMPNVLDDLSLHFNKGEYVALVGATGCGKSTLFRLLLGFEQPQRGSIYYDHKDISVVDVQSLRKHIGVVLQDGKLFSGDIYSNITISAPHLTMDEAWEAAETAAVADDIRAMPMGMHTMISDGQGGISGGQKQRLMIARAIAPKPKILLFDEATSALDNVTQKKVSDAIDQMHCTRIVIAHRLSTIRHADRILYLEHGKVAESGTYDELIEKNGLFAKLVERQRLDFEQ